MGQIGERFDTRPWWRLQGMNRALFGSSDEYKRHLLRARVELVVGCPLPPAIGRFAPNAAIPAGSIFGRFETCRPVGTMSDPGGNDAIDPEVDALTYRASLLCSASIRRLQQALHSLTARKSVCLR
jgi:hypothetical protein